MQQGIRFDFLKITGCSFFNNLEEVKFYQRWLVASSSCKGCRWNEAALVGSDCINKQCINMIQSRCAAQAVTKAGLHMLDSFALYRLCRTGHALEFQGVCSASEVNVIGTSD